MRTPGLALTLITLLALASVPASAQYKWRDAQGRIAVSDRPPPSSVPAKDIIEQPAASTPASRLAREMAPPPVEKPVAAPTQALRGEAAVRMRDADMGRQVAEGETAKLRKALDEKNAATERDNCARARSSLATLDSGVRVTRRNDAGEREFLDDKQREAETNQARGMVASNCK